MSRVIHWLDIPKDDAALADMRNGLLAEMKAMMPEYDAIALKWNTLLLNERKLFEEQMRRQHAAYQRRTAC